MHENDREFANGVEEILRTSVTNTISLLFNIPVDVSRDMSHDLPHDEGYVCCGEFSQDDARAKLMVSFDRELIKKLAHLVFSAAEAETPAIYESTVTEIVNIVGNQLKVHLNLQGYKLTLAIPYIVDEKAVPAENPLIHLAFSLKDDSAMGVDFYMRTA
jgi:CheY-specific phosphatase CheX